MMNTITDKDSGKTYTTKVNSSVGGVSVECSCGWHDYWRVQDGSAQMALSLHKHLS